MRTTLASAAATIGVLAAILAPGANAAASKVDLAFEPIGMNDAGAVLGTRYGAPSWALLAWNAGVERTLTRPVEASSAISIGEDGSILGDANVDELGTGPMAVFTWAPGSATATQVGTYPRGSGGLGRGIDDAGRWTSIQQTGGTCDAGGIKAVLTRSDGATVQLDRLQSGSTSGRIASDGSFVEVGAQCSSNPVFSGPVSRWSSGDGTQQVQFDGISITDIAPGGMLAGYAADPTLTTPQEEVPVQVRRDAKTGELVTTRHPIPGLGVGTQLRVFTSDSGRMFANNLAATGTTMWRFDKGAWTDVTNEYKAAGFDQQRDVSKIVDVNGAGDVLVHNDAWGASADTGAIFRERVPLTGQLTSSTVSSGRAVVTVTIVDAAGTRTVKTNAAGKFSTEVPPGDVRVTAPSGSCVVAKNGCFQSATITVAPGAARATLTTTAIKSVAAWVTAKLALIKAPAGTAVVRVKCSSTVACTGVTVTLRTGRTVRGSGKVAKVAAGKSVPVNVVLNRAAKVWLLAQAKPVTVGATLVAKAGAEQASITQTIRLSK